MSRSIYGDSLEGKGGSMSGARGRAAVLGGLWPVILSGALAAPLHAQDPGSGLESAPGSDRVVLPTALTLQETQEERLRRVEEQLRRQQEKIDEQQRKIEQFERLKGKKGHSLYATFTDGFHLLDDEGDFDLRVGGRLILHYRDVFGLPHSFANGPGTPPAFLARSQPDTIYINSAYLIMEGTIFREWGYRVTAEVTSTATGSSARTET